MKAVVIGAGRMGQRHVQVVRDLGLTLVGVCDRNMGALGAPMQALDVPPEKQFSDAAAMLEQTSPDCVIIATTAPSHTEYTRLAAKAGAKYILCEKPMAVSLAGCDQMIAVCQQHGAKLAINHQMRFMEQYTKAKEVVTSAAFGGLSSVTVVAGNFGMAMNGTHYFEMFRYMTDEPPIEATAWFSETKLVNPRGPQFEDRAGAVRLTTASGKRYYMEIGEDQGHGMQVTYAGPYGRLTVDELAGKAYLTVRKPEHRALPSTRYGMPWDEQEIAITPADAVAPSRAVLNALLNGEDYPSGEDGRLAVATLVAAYVSDENGHVAVPIDDTLPRDRVFPWA